jgi:hypothetical protein
VFVIGTRKGGTTSLFSYLDNHPNFTGSARKEPHYFGNTQFFLPDCRYYYKLFYKHACEKSGMLSGEASVSYLSSCNAAQRIAVFADVFGLQPKFIVLLREPVTLLLPPSSTFRELPPFLPDPLD